MMYITVGSVTTASRLAKRLAQLGDSGASVVHTPSEINRGGCSYSVRTNIRDTETIQNLADEYGIQIRKFYRVDTVNGRNVYHVISG